MGIGARASSGEQIGRKQWNKATESSRSPIGLEQGSGKFRVASLRLRSFVIIRLLPLSLLLLLSLGVAR